MNEEEKVAALEMLKFRGQIEKIAKEYGGTFVSEPKLIDKIVEDFSKSKPSNKKKWLAERIEPMFKCINERPRWICDPEWPYHNGESMVFIEQINVDDREEIRSIITVDTVLYIFGALEPFEGSKMQVYKVIEQLRDFAFTKDK